MKVYTENSVYELDKPNKLVRRLKGANDPTPRMGVDGEWKPYADVMGCKVGMSLIILWSIENEGELAKTTITSTITKIA